MHPILTRVQTKLFPHISRIFSSKVIFSLACVVFLGVNIVFSYYLPQSYDAYRKAILDRPFSIDSYVRFGQALYAQGNNVAAAKQITVATNVLGAQTEFQNVLSQWEHASSAKSRAYDYWKHIIATYPQYRDGYVQLAQVSYDLARLDEAKTYLYQAQTLDPNNTLVIHMQKEMGF
jgi:tetratricopeptide (TPR) repeat protein